MRDLVSADGNRESYTSGNSSGARFSGYVAGVIIAVLSTFLSPIGFASPAQASGGFSPGPSPELLVKVTLSSSTNSYRPATNSPLVDYKWSQILLGIQNSSNTSSVQLAPASSSLFPGNVACNSAASCSSMVEVFVIRSGQRVDFSVQKFRLAAGETRINIGNSASESDPADPGFIGGDEIYIRIQAGYYTIPPTGTYDASWVRLDTVNITNVFGGFGGVTSGQTSAMGYIATYSPSLIPATTPATSSSSPSSPATVAPPTRPYEGPLNLRHSGTAICSGGDATITGLRLDTIKEVTVAGKPTTFEMLADGNLKYSLKDVAAGKHQVKFWVPINGLYLTDQITVGTCSTAPVTTTPGAFSASKLFANYRGDRGPVIARDRAAITAFINQYKGITNVRCVGSTSGVPAKRTDPALAQARAKNACDIVKTLVPNATYTLETSTGKGVGQRFRSVTIVISGSN